MGHSDCEPAAVTATKCPGKTLEFLGPGDNVRIVMMEYLNMDTFFNMPDADMKLMLEDAAESPPDT